VRYRKKERKMVKESTGVIDTQESNAEKTANESEVLSLDKEKKVLKKRFKRTHVEDVPEKGEEKALVDKDILKTLSKKVGKDKSKVPDKKIKRFYKKKATNDSNIVDSVERFVKSTNATAFYFFELLNPLSKLDYLLTEDSEDSLVRGAEVLEKYFGKQKEDLFSGYLALLAISFKRLALLNGNVTGIRLGDNVRVDKLMYMYDGEVDDIKEQLKKAMSKLV
jgi:hypothetical protein